MVGAAYYLAHQLPDPNLRPPWAGERQIENSDLPEIAKDSIAPVARYLALRDAPWFFSPMLIEDGRQLLIGNLRLDNALNRGVRRLDVTEQTYSRQGRGAG